MGAPLPLMTVGYLDRDKDLSSLSAGRLHYLYGDPSQALTQLRHMQECKQPTVPFRSATKMVCRRADNSDVLYASNRPENDLDHLRCK